LDSLRIPTLEEMKDSQENAQIHGLKVPVPTKNNSSRQLFESNFNSGNQGFFIKINM